MIIIFNKIRYKIGMLLVNLAEKLFDTGDLKKKIWGFKILKLANKIIVHSPEIHDIINETFNLLEQYYKG